MKVKESGTAMPRVPVVMKESCQHIRDVKAVALVTKTFGELEAKPEIGRAEALRRAMLGLIGKGVSREAHPAFWAPFVVVGEGAAAR